MILENWLFKKEIKKDWSFWKTFFINEKKFFLIYQYWNNNIEYLFKDKEGFIQKKHISRLSKIEDWVDKQVYIWDEMEIIDWKKKKTLFNLIERFDSIEIKFK